MKKQIVRLTESDLHRIIKESVTIILNENPAAIAAGARIAASQGARASATGAAAKGGLNLSKYLSNPNFIKSAAEYGKQFQDSNDKMRNDTSDYIDNMANNEDGLKGYFNKTLDYSKNMGQNISNAVKSGLNFAKDNPEFVSDLITNIK